MYLAYQTRGQPPKQPQKWLLQHWEVIENGGPWNAAVDRVSSTEQKFFWCNCGKLHHCGKRHLTYKQIKTVQASHVTLNCELCSPTRKLSSHEVMLRDHLVEANQRTGMSYMVEVRVLQGRYGPVDVYFHTEDLVVQMDGEQHFKHNCPQSYTYKDVQPVDSRFNDECIRQKRCLLRIHFEDAADSIDYILKALHMCVRKGGRKQCFVFHSYNFMAPNDGLQWY